MKIYVIHAQKTMFKLTLSLRNLHYLQWPGDIYALIYAMGTNGIIEMVMTFVERAYGIADFV